MSTHGTLLTFNEEHRVMVVGWESGEISVSVFSEYLTTSEMRSMLSPYAKPIMIKYGSRVQAPIPQERPRDGTVLDLEYEIIDLERYAAATPSGEFLSLWCGFSPRTHRWFVRV